MLAWGHDAPANVTVFVQMRAEAGAMRALVRIPLEAVRDVDFPAVEGGYLDVARLAPRLPGLAQIWVGDVFGVFEDGVAVGKPRIVGTQISVESDRSFATFDAAAARLRAPLPGKGERLFWKQVFFDVELTFSIRSASAKFAVKPGFVDLGERVQTVLHYRDRVFLLPGDQEPFPLEPGWWEAAWRFVRMGFVHILDGADHLLFLLCLVIPLRRMWPLVCVVTAFTLAHSVTLAISALGWAPDALWFPAAVELSIAGSIVFMAVGNIVGWTGERRWLVAFGFGLVHGFGFSFALKESLQFAGGHLAAALLAFNFGVELGQLAALGVMVVGLRVAFRFVEERVGMIVLSTLVAHTGWHWMWERWEVLGRYAVPAPGVSFVLKCVLAGMVFWGVDWVWRRWRME